MPGSRASSIREVRKDKAALLGLLHLKSTPRKAEVVKWGYDCSTGSGMRDCCATGVLATLLVITAVTVSFFFFFCTATMTSLLLS